MIKYLQKPVLRYGSFRFRLYEAVCYHKGKQAAGGATTAAIFSDIFTNRLTTTHEQNCTTAACHCRCAVIQHGILAGKTGYQYGAVRCIPVIRPFLFRVS